MSHGIHITSKFLKGLSSLTGLSTKKIEEYAKSNNPFNILEHPLILEPNQRQLEKIGLLNEFISSYNLLKIYEEQNVVKIDSSPKAGSYFVSLIGGMKDKERFFAAFLDNSYGVIETRNISEGTLNECAIYPRDVLKAALACDCRSIIFAHNHPGNSTIPSAQDKLMTQRMVDIFTPLDIKIIDHIVVGGNSYCSMAEQGYVATNSLGKANYEPIELKEECVRDNSSQNTLEDEENDWEI